MVKLRPIVRTVVLTMVAALILVAGVLFASPPAVAVGAVILVAVLVDLVWFGAASLRQGIPQLHRQAAPNPSQVGDIVTVRLSVAGPSGSSGGGLDETMPAQLSGRVRVRPASSHAGAAQLTYDVAAPHRGLWTLGPCTLSRHSPLGLWWGRVLDRETSAIMVWPRLVDLDPGGPRPDREGAVGRHARLQPSSDNSTVRTYVAGDDLRRIHWRSSAKRGELMTRAEEPNDTVRAVAGVVVQPGTDPAVRERAISLVASWLRLMGDLGHTLELGCAGVVRPGALADHLDRLATVTSAELAAPLPSMTSEGTVLVAITAARGQSAPIDDVRLTQFDSGRTGRAVAVIWSGREQDGSRLSQSGWSTLVVDDSQSLADVAGRLGEVQRSWQSAGAR